MQIARDHHDTILRLARNNRREVCGLLSKHGDGSPAELYQFNNVAAEPERSYEVAPMEQMRVFDDMRASGTEIAAIWHSHPNQPPEPSQTDLNRAFFPDALYLIAGRVESEWKIMAWRINNGHATNVDLTIIEPEPLHA